MLLALLVALALAQHTDPDQDSRAEVDVEQRLDDLEELVEARDQELDELRTAAARLLELVEAEHGDEVLEVAPEDETGDNAGVPTGEPLELEEVQELEKVGPPGDTDTAED